MTREDFLLLYFVSVRCFSYSKLTVFEREDIFEKKKTILFCLFCFCCCSLSNKTETTFRRDRDSILSPVQSGTRCRCRSQFHTQHPRSQRFSSPGLVSRRDQCEDKFKMFHKVQSNTMTEEHENTPTFLESRSFKVSE